MPFLFFPLHQKAVILHRLSDRKDNLNGRRFSFYPQSPVQKKKDNSVRHARISIWNSDSIEKEIFVGLLLLSAFTRQSAGLGGKNHLGVYSQVSFSS